MGAAVPHLLPIMENNFPLSSYIPTAEWDASLSASLFASLLLFSIAYTLPLLFLCVVLYAYSIPFFSQWLCTVETDDYWYKVIVKNLQCSDFSIFSVLISVELFMKRCLLLLKLPLLISILYAYIYVFMCVGYIRLLMKIVMLNSFSFC